MALTHKQQFNKRHKFDKDASHSLKEISSISKYSMKILKEVYERGIGAYKTNPSSVRPQVKSKEMWAMARVYAFVNKLEKGIKLNHDTDLLN
jgi:hypothetical protein